jgi:hypothetical protein
MTAKLAQLLIAHYDSVFTGPNGDYPAVLEALEAVHADKAAWKPAPGSNSIWQITDHLSASNVWQQEMLEKGQAASPAWTEPPGGESAWEASLARLRETHASLVAALPCRNGKRPCWSCCSPQPPTKPATPARSIT